MEAGDEDGLLVVSEGELALEPVGESPAMDNLDRSAASEGIILDPHAEHEVAQLSGFEVDDRGAIEQWVLCLACVLSHGLESSDDGFDPWMIDPLAEGTRGRIEERFIELALGGEQGPPGPFLTRPVIIHNEAAVIRDQDIDLSDEHEVLQTTALSPIRSIS
jgi:hypothetical protein